MVSKLATTTTFVPMAADATGRMDVGAFVTLTSTGSVAVAVISVNVFPATIKLFTPLTALSFDTAAATSLDFSVFTVVFNAALSDPALGVIFTVATIEPLASSTVRSSIVYPVNRLKNACLMLSTSFVFTVLFACTLSKSMCFTVMTTVTALVGAAACDGAIVVDVATFVVVAVVASFVVVVVVAVVVVVVVVASFVVVVLGAMLHLEGDAQQLFA